MQWKLASLPPSVFLTLLLFDREGWIYGLQPCIYVCPLFFLALRCIWWPELVCDVFASTSSRLSPLGEDYAADAVVTFGLVLLTTLFMIMVRVVLGEEWLEAVEVIID